MERSQDSNQQLIDYIQQARAAGMSDDAIRQELLKNGWQEADITAAVGQVLQPIAQVPLAVQTVYQQPIAETPSTTSASKTRKIILFSALALLVLGGGYYYLWHTVSGKKVLNRYFPDAARTLELMEMAVKDINAYKQHTERGQGNNTIISDGIFVPPDRFQVVINQPFVRTSTAKALSQKMAVTRFQSEIYAEDPVMGNYYEVPTNTIAYSQINSLSHPEYSTVFELFKDLLSQLKPHKKDGILLFTDSNGNSYSIDPVSYNIREATFQKEGEIISARFEPVSSVDIAIPDHNGFGGFWDRESVIFRTDLLGSNDTLWARWEDHHFHCERCVNPFGDDDNDGLQNSLEFIFGSNPTLKDTNGENGTDHEDLLGWKNPTSGKELRAEFRGALDLFPVQTSGADSVQGIRIRPASFVASSNIPDDAIYLKVDVEHDAELPDNGYCIVFIDGERVFSFSEEPGKKTIQIPIEDHRGELIRMQFVMMLGPAGASTQFTNFRTSAVQEFTPLPGMKDNRRFTDLRSV